MRKRLETLKRLGDYLLESDIKENASIILSNALTLQIEIYGDQKFNDVLISMEYYDKNIGSLSIEEISCVVASTDPVCATISMVDSKHRVYNYNISKKIRCCGIDFGQNREISDVWKNVGIKVFQVLSF